MIDKQEHEMYMRLLQEGFSPKEAYHLVKETKRAENGINKKRA